MGSGVYEITQRGVSERYLVELKDSEGMVLLTSQYREQQPMCLNEITWMRSAALKDVMYVPASDEDGKYMVLHANDAHILGETPRFETDEELAACVEAIKAIAADAETVDTTPELDLSTKMHGILQDYARETVELGCEPVLLERN